MAPVDLQLDGCSCRSNPCLMGMDSVELVMAIEKEFGISIPDSDAAGLVIVGDMHAYIAKAAAKLGHPMNESMVWDSLKRLIVEQIGVHEERITPTSNFITDLGLD